MLRVRNRATARLLVARDAHREQLEAQRAKTLPPRAWSGLGARLGVRVRGEVRDGVRVGVRVSV